MPTFWEQFKKPFRSVGKTIGSVFAKTKAPTPEGYRPFKAQPVETMAQFFGVGKRPSAFIETLEKPREVFEDYLERAQKKRLEKRISAGKKPAPFIRFFGEELGKEIGITTIEIAKNLARAPFKITKQFKYHPIFYKGKEPEWKIPGLGEITTYGEDYLRREKEFRDMGIDDRTANIAAILGVGSEAILDVAILASWIESGAKAIARKATPQLQEKIAAWKLMGQPKTPEVLNKSWRQLAHQFHPDKIGGSGKAMKEINKAYSILNVKGGLPTSKELITAKAARAGEMAISPISKIMELPRPKVVLPLKMLPERAGYMPAEPFKPFREIKVGLQIKPTPMKPAAKEVAKRIVKYELPAKYTPKMGKPTWKHGQMLWKTLRNSYGETNKFGKDITANRGAVVWVIDRLSGGTKKLAPLMKKYEGQRMSVKQYKKMYAMFKGRDYDLAGYRHVMANLKGIEPMITEITKAPPAKIMAEVMKPKVKAPKVEKVKPEIKPEVSPARPKLEEMFRKPGEITIPAKIELKPVNKKAALTEASKAIDSYTKVEGAFGILNQGKVVPMNKLAKEIADLGYKPQIVPHPTIKDSYTIRPYKLGYGCDGSTDGNLHFLTKDMLAKRGLSFEEVYKTAYPGDPVPKNLEGFAKETIVPKAWGETEATQLAKDLRQINNYRLADAIESLPKEPTMKSIGQIMAERSGKPPIEPPKPPRPRTVSPAPEEPPKGLKITERRMREINRKGISPEEFAPALEAQKRGKIPFPEIIKKSEALNADIEKIARLKPGTVTKAEQVEAYRQAVNGFKKQVDKLKQNYLADPTNTANKLAFDKARATLNRAVVNVEAIRSELARGLSVARIEDEISRAASNINKIRAKLTPEKQIIFDKRVDAISLEDPSEVMRLLTEFNKAGIVEKVLEYYKASLLSAPITHIRNTTGNTIFLVFDIPTRALAGGLDAVKAIAGKPRTVYSMEAIKELHGGMKAVPDAVTEAIKALKDEFYQYGTRRMTVEVGTRLPAIKGLKGRIIRLPYRALSAMDIFSRTIKVSMETDALAYRLAKQEGKKGIELVERIAQIKAQPPADMVSLIDAKAKRALFLEEMGGILKGLETFKNKYPAVQFIIPFYRTPVNLVREAYRLTPARFITRDQWLKNPSTRMEEIARTILGSLIGGTIVWKMLDGSIDITGPAPRKSAERDLFYRQGKQPYSIRIGDRWYSYREIHPFSTIAFGAHQIAEMVKLYKEKAEIDEEEIARQADRIISDTAEYIQDLTFFQGLGNFIEAISGGTYNQGIMTTGKNYLAQLFGGFIPNFLYSYQRAADPTIYKTKGFVEQIKKRIPGMQEGLMPRRTVFGIPIERTGGFLIQFLSPVKVSKERRDVVDKELERLDIAVGYPQRSAFGEPLTDYEYDAYLQDSGHRIYEQLWAMIRSAQYQGVTDYEREGIIAKVSREAREQSRYALFTDKKKIADLRKKFEAQGLTEAQARQKAEEELKKPHTIGEMFTAKTAGTLEDLRSLIMK